MLPSPSIEPIVYFFTNSLAVIASAAVLFFALGILYGWLTWAKYKRRARAYREETDLLRHEIARLKRLVAGHGAPEPAEAPQVVPVPVSAKEDAKAVPESIPAVSVPSDVSPAAAAPGPGPKKESLAAAILGPGAAHVALAPAAPPDEIIPDVKSAGDAGIEQPEKPKSVEAPVAAASEPAGEPTPPPAGVAEASSKPPPDTAAAGDAGGKNGHPVTPATLAFDAEMKAGHVVYDPDLGIRYHARPDRWDDLTLLRGVAETLQERLHEAGIFTFKQIALWSDAQSRQVALRISAKDRVQRDRWVQQALDLHYLKYGERLI